MHILHSRLANTIECNWSAVILHQDVFHNPHEMNRGNAPIIMCIYTLKFEAKKARNLCGLKAKSRGLGGDVTKQARPSLKPQPCSLRMAFESHFDTLRVRDSLAWRRFAVDAGSHVALFAIAGRLIARGTIRSCPREPAAISACRSDISVGFRRGDNRRRIRAAA